MATYTSSQVGTTNTTGTMRPHVAFVEALLTAAGWVQTADTGQTASGAFPAATGTTTVAGYQIWRMADSLQGTYPVFVKFEFGSGIAATSLGVWLTVGTGSNGTGTITGALGTRGICTVVAASASSLPAYGSGDTGGLVAIHNYQTATAQCSGMWMVERTRDAAGAYTSYGVVLAILVGTQTTYQTWQMLPFAVAAPALRGMATVALPAAMGAISLTSGADTGLIPSLPLGPRGPLDPSLGMLFYYGPDITVATDVSVTISGASHTYKTLGTPYLWGASVTGWTSSGFAIRYE